MSKHPRLASFFVGLIMTLIAFAVNYKLGSHGAEWKKFVPFSILVFGILVSILMVSWSFTTEFNSFKKSVLSQKNLPVLQIYPACDGLGYMTISAHKAKIIYNTVISLHSKFHSKSDIEGLTEQKNINYFTIIGEKS